MTEFLSSAWAGWLDYTSHGKLAAVFLAAMLFLWFGAEKCKQKSFLIYTTCMAVACICPLTAVGLMLYQTRFYDYPFLWSAVPVTALIALAFVLFAEKMLKGRTRAVIAVSLGILAVMLFVGGGLGVTGVKWTNYGQERDRVEKVLLPLEEEYNIDWILWAPAEIMEYARDVDDRIELLYGRNMWDEHLNAYTYDTYPDYYRDMYLWMTRGWDRGNLTDREIAQAVWDTNVNCILLPGDIETEIVECFEEELGVEARDLGEYILFHVY